MVYDAGWAAVFHQTEFVMVEEIAQEERMKQIAEIMSVNDQESPAALQEIIHNLFIF